MRILKSIAAKYGYDMKFDIDPISIDLCSWAMISEHDFINLVNMNDYIKLTNKDIERLENLHPGSSNKLRPGCVFLNLNVSTSVNHINLSLKI